jgi:23S rRNA (guanosine2251-2'-O)-methyltransferase
MSDVIEGKNPVLEALKAGRPLHKILLASTIGQNSSVAEILYLARSQGVPVEHVSKEALNRLSQTAAHQGVIAYGASKDCVALEDLLDISQRKKEPPLYCILDGIEDPHNFGSIIRSADASGIHGIVIRSRRAVGLTAAVSKASAGAIEYVPVAMVSNISQAIEKLKRNGVWIIGVDTDGEIEYSKADFTLPIAIVIGSEGKGISDLVKKNCDYLVSIPMKGKITSLNASVAAALAMYEAFNQRKQL